MPGLVFAHVGLGDMVCANHVLAIIQPFTVTAKRYVRNAKKMGRYVDASHGKSIKSIILMDEGTVVASHISTITLQSRFNKDVDTHQPYDDLKTGQPTAPAYADIFKELYGEEAEDDEEEEFEETEEDTEEEEDDEDEV